MSYSFDVKIKNSSELSRQWFLMEKDELKLLKMHLKKKNIQIEEHLNEKKPNEQIVSNNKLLIMQNDVFKLNGPNSKFYFSLSKGYEFLF
jgi:hypothetical protein